MKRLTNFIPILIILVVLLIVIPLPIPLLDFMFIFNITVSVIILLTTMYITDALQFSILPSLLLITTVLRLALNISSTRLVLGNGGQAGKVIETFGNFVLGRNVVVGFVIFIIIVIVQFIVISKGSERVSEVAARFTLDAMPGKQMSIDADLSAGIINDQEAKMRRCKIQKEADFYGAMDGASKFVKGDAIVSIIIVFVNFLGGVIIGMVNGGKSLTEILNIYSISTVGDGLVSQLPSLMISTATGIVVTRAASDESFTIDISKQFLSQPYALLVAGITLEFLMIIPGFPKWPPLLLGALLIFLGIRLINTQKNIENILGEETTGQDEEAIKESDYYRNIDNIYELITVETMEIEFGYSLIPMVSESKGGTFVERIVMLRKQFAVDMGMVFPPIRLRDNNMLNPNQYVIKIKDEEIARGEILVDYYLALDSGNTKGDIEGIDTIEPAYGIPSKWIFKTEREKAEVLGYTVIDPVSVIISHLSEVIKHHAHELLSKQDVNTLIENIKKIGRITVDDVIPDIISIIDFHRVLCNLLKEFIPIKDMETIIDTIAVNGTTKDINMLTECVRQSLKRTITGKFARDGSLMVIALSPDIEKLILNNIKKAGNKTYLNIEPEVITQLIAKINEQIEKHKEMFVIPIILTSSVVRIHISQLLEQFISNFIVLSFSEIENSVQILALGNVSLD